MLGVDEDPFGLGWEQRPQIDDGHGHQWARVWVNHSWTAREPVVRCAVCHCPRCGESTDADPCMERRHHRGMHVTLHGRFWPLGDYLSDETAL